MTLAEQQEHFQDLTKRMSDTMLKKGNDYANEDRLSNFKLAAQIVGITPEQVVLTMIAIKAIRLGNLLQPGKVPNFESIEDNLLDHANYSALLDMLRADMKQYEKPYPVSSNDIEPEEEWRQSPTRQE